MKTYETDSIAVSFDVKRCIHARRCVLNFPAVFQAGAKGGWIIPGNASADELAQLIDTCPSGALTYTRKDDGDNERLPQVNTARLWENGPVVFSGQLNVPRGETHIRAVFCRCGHSKNKPYCDNSHVKAGFEATADAPTTE